MTRTSSSSSESATEIESSYLPGSAHGSPYLSPLSPSSSSASPLTSYSNNDREHSHHRLHTLPPLETSQSRLSVPAIFNQQYYNNNTHHSQDVPRPHVNSSAISHSSTATRHGPSSNNPLDNSSSSSSNVSLTHPNSVALQQLANHYGIPSVLPKPPLSKSATKTQQSQSTRSTPPLPDFQYQLSNYLSMLAQKPESDPTNTTPMSNNIAEDASSMDNDADDAMQSVVQTLMASPEFNIQAIMDSPAISSPNSFLTSPFDTPNHQFDASPLIDFADTFGDTSPMDTPLFDEFNTSPIDDSPFLDALSTPVMDAVDGMEMFANGSPLFDDGGVGMYQDLETSLKPSAAPEVEWDKLLKMSPQTPSLDPSLVYPSPSLQSEQSFPVPSSKSATSGATVAPTNRRKQPTATGTRRNITPQSLVPHDAPTQPRRYVTPSVTSKKEVPATFARKKRKAVSGAVAVGEDELDCDADLPPLKPDATEMEQIEYKRRQNTLAARKSRKRKLEYQQGIEDENEQLKNQVEAWKTRCEVLSGMLKGAGIHVDLQDLGNTK
ncbi:hypothetical protein E1B28_005996 [Marasmius oreades]|uniref:BZIP domain-containing protein n=1 Tax=Marasmius oreades TaxID=181124 RepID=A0A9P7UVZ6_9AGAR|nr:uncharacterized protein E1B28_005996 [Marasmius oreades]KAG7095221.1 hypothetical protein E1B28_005996 [Marasmius oreades]